MRSNNVTIAVIVICILAAGITLLIGRLFPKKRSYKYIPAVTGAGASIASYIKSIYATEGFQGLGYIILAMGGIIFVTVSLATALIIERINKKII